MTSQNPRADIYDPKTLAAMDQAFGAWHCGSRKATSTSGAPTSPALQPS